MTNNRIERKIYILRNREPKAIEYVQGASAVPIMLSLQDYRIPEGAAARIYVLKPSGKGEYDTAAIEDNGVLVDVKSTMFNETGVNYIQALVTLGDKTLITFSQEVEVSPNRVPGEVPESENNSDFLDEYLAEMDEKKANADRPVFTGSVSMGRKADSTVGENSTALGLDVQAIGEGSVAVGKSTTAGIREYYIKSIDPSDKKIYLCNEEVLTVISSDDNTDTAFEAPGYEIGDSFVITNREHYGVEEGITGISHNVITYDGDLGFTEIRESETGCTFSVLAKPTVGDVAPSHGMVAAGEDNIAIGVGSFACNTDNVAVGNRSFSSGWRTRALGEVAHVEGVDCTAEGFAAHAEGYDTRTHGEASHAEGFGTKAAGHSSHAEGIYAQANGEASHAEGSDAQANGLRSHAEGYAAVAGGEASHAEGFQTKAAVHSAHAEGNNTTANGEASHVEGASTTAQGSAAHAEGTGTTAGGQSSHAEGGHTHAGGLASHAEGNGATANGEASHAEGNRTLAPGNYSHAEGQETQTAGTAAHAEGIECKANGEASHAEGVRADAAGHSSHAEGWEAKAGGRHSHAEGYYTTACGDYSHVQGKYNTLDTEGKYAHIVGNGTSDTHRSNAHTVDWQGNGWYAGSLEATALILKSSTPGSAKRFKITVDDSGTLMAVEI